MYSCIHLGKKIFGMPEKSFMGTQNNSYIVFYSYYYMVRFKFQAVIFILSFLEISSA